MPQYDYRCSGCGNIFEARHGYDDAAPACPTCGAPEPKKVIQAVGVIMKGATPGFSPDAGCPNPMACEGRGCLGSRFSRN